MKNLKELREYLNSIPNINEGGCLISAYSMYLYLKKTNQLPPDFRILEIATDDTLRFLLHRNLKSPDPTKYTTGCSHAMCQVGEIIFDSGESRPIDIDIDVVAVVSSVIVDPEKQSDHIIAQINTDGWNNNFNREIYVPKIQQDLGIDLSMIKLKFTQEDKEKAIKTFNDEDERLRKAVSAYKKSTGYYNKLSPSNRLERAILEAIS